VSRTLTQPSAPATLVAAGPPLFRRALVGYLGLALLPLLLLADTALARARGWSAASEGTFGKLPYLFAAAVVALALPLVFAGYRRWLARRAGQLWLASTTTLVAAAIGDAALRFWLPTAPFHLRPPLARFQFDPDYTSFPGVTGGATSAINAQGVRGAAWPARDKALRVLCLGGSTTECLFLDDDEAWPAQLGADLSQQLQRPVWTGAAAVSEYASGQHLRFLRESPLVEEVDCVVVLVGVGDLVRTLLGLDAGAAPPPWWIDTRALSLVKEIWNVRLRKGLVVDFDGRNYTAKRRSREFAPPPGYNIPAALDAYAARLRQLVATAQSRGVSLVLVTQPTLWDDFLNPILQQRLALGRVTPAPRKWKQLLPRNLRENIDRFNLRLIAVAQESGTPLVDAATSMSGEGAYFYDDYHLSEAGCQELARLVAQRVAPALQQRTN